MQIPPDPTPKFCSIQKQNCGMINTLLNECRTDEKVKIPSRADCLCPEISRNEYTVQDDRRKDAMHNLMKNCSDNPEKNTNK